MRLIELLDEAGCRGLDSLCVISWSNRAARLHQAIRREFVRAALRGNPAQAVLIGLMVLVLQLGIKGLAHERVLDARFLPGWSMRSVVLTLIHREISPVDGIFRDIHLCL